MDAQLRLGLGRQRRLHRAQAVALDLDVLAIGQRRLQPVGRDLRHHGGAQVVVVGMLVERLRDRGVLVLRVHAVGQVDLALRAAPGLAALVVHQRAAQRLVRGDLVVHAQRRGHPQAAAVGLVAVLGVDHLPHHLRGVLAVGQPLLLRAAQPDRLVARLLRLRRRDHPHVHHPLQHHRLAALRARQVHDRVRVIGVLRQARQHRGLADRQFLQRLAVVRMRCRLEAVGPLTQVDLVHVDLQDLVLGQLALDLEGQQDLDELAGVELLLGQVEVARQLLGDGRGALAARREQVGQRRPEDAGERDALVLVEAGVLDRQQRLLHGLGDAVQRQVAAALGAELGQQLAVLGVDAQRLLGVVVGQPVQVGQARPDHRRRARQQQHHGQHARARPDRDALPRRERAQRGPHRRGAAPQRLEETGHGGGDGASELSELLHAGRTSSGRRIIVRQAGLSGAACGRQQSVHGRHTNRVRPRGGRHQPIRRSSVRNTSALSAKCSAMASSMRALSA